MYAVRDQMMLNNKEFEAEDIESALENYIFPILYNKMISELDLKERDDFVLVSQFNFIQIKKIYFYLYKVAM